MPEVAPAASVRRLGCNRGRLQDRNRFPPQTVRHVLDGSKRQSDIALPSCHLHGPIRGLLGGPPARITSAFMSHTPILET